MVLTKNFFESLSTSRTESDSLYSDFRYASSYWFHHLQSVHQLTKRDQPKGKRNSVAPRPDMIRLLYLTLNDKTSLDCWSHQRDIEVLTKHDAKIIIDCVSMWKDPATLTEAQPLDAWISRCTDVYRDIFETAARAIALRAWNGTYYTGCTLEFVAQILDVPRGVLKFDSFGPVLTTNHVLEAVAWVNMEPTPR
jgi:hypothetical protein